MSMLLRAERLTKDYGSFRAVDELDLEVGPGEVVGVLGPNGSGKSTALRMMLGFLRPTSGNATIAGFDCWDQGDQARRHVTYLPGELRMYENMTGRELVEFLGGLRGQNLSPEIPSLASRYDIDVSRPLSQLSSGMKRKIALMAVLLPRTPLVILDEPTNALDPTMRDQLLSQILEAKQRGQSVLFSSHVLTEVERVCDRVAILRRGKLVHWEDRKSLPETHRIRAKLRSPIQHADYPEGVRVTQQTPNFVELHVDGHVNDVLAWLAKQPLGDLRVEPAGLADVYAQYHPAVELASENLS